MEHEHHHEHCNDPGCSCHEHEHEHHHDHCDDPNCSCHEHEHGSEAERIVDSSFVISRTRHFDCTVSVQALTVSLEKLFISLGRKADFEGIIPGHIKGVIMAPGGERLGISVTRPGTVDFVPASGWEALEHLDSFEMTVNIMLLSDIGITEEDLFNGIV